MILIDTNILLTDILEQYETDESSVAYRDLYRQIALPERVITAIVLGEFEIYMTRVMPSRFSLDAKQKKEIRNITASYVGKVLDACTLISPSSELMQEAYEIYHHNWSDRFISYTDSLLIAIARYNRIGLLTQDKRMQAIAKEMEVNLISP